MVSGQDVGGFGAREWRRRWRLGGWGVETWRLWGEMKLETWRLESGDLVAGEGRRRWRLGGWGVETTLETLQMWIGDDVETWQM